MCRTMTLGAAFLMLLGIAMACASIEPIGTIQAQHSAEVRESMLELKQAFNNIENRDYEKAAPELDKLIASPGFGQLTTKLRSLTLSVASAIALQDRHYAKAHHLAVRATGFEQATSDAWMNRLFGALNTSDNFDAGRCVVVVGEQWPKLLDEVRPEWILQIHEALGVAHEEDLDRSMLEALFESKWQAEHSAYDTMWRDLALIEIEHNEPMRAALIAQRIRDAGTALSIRVDKRFDPITLSHPEAFDVDRMLDAQIQVARARIKAHPDQLLLVQRLQDLLLEKGQDAQVLAISDAAVGHAERGDGKKTYTDFSDRYNLILDLRSNALAHEGHWGDAVHAMIRAAKLRELGGVNVSQSINLAGLLIRLDQPDKAAAAVAVLGNMSPYGSMQLHYIRLQIAIEKNDTRSIAKQMAYLREHRAVAIGTWQKALLWHDDLDAAAALLIQRLNTPDWRSDALVDMQHFVDSQRTPTMKAMDQRWDTITSRPDVQAVLAKVGRVEHFNITATAY